MIFGLVLFISSCRFLCVQGLGFVLVMFFRLSRFFLCVVMFQEMIWLIFLERFLCGGKNIQLSMFRLCLSMFIGVCNSVVVRVLLIMISVVGLLSRVLVWLFLRKLLLMMVMNVRVILIRLSIFISVFFWFGEGVCSLLCGWLLKVVFLFLYVCLLVCFDKVLVDVVEFVYCVCQVGFDYGYWYFVDYVIGFVLCLYLVVVLFEQVCIFVFVGVYVGEDYCQDFVVVGFGC